jgi:hypothetical protein
LNFFQVAQSMILVDLPGYGHGSRKEWLDLIKSYCIERKTYAEGYQYIPLSPGRLSGNLLALDGSTIAFALTDFSAWSC